MKQFEDDVARVRVTAWIPANDATVAYFWDDCRAVNRSAGGAGRYPQPVALLARLSVDLDHERRGLGAGLLKDVIARFLVVADEIGCRALLVHAESDVAKDYYLHLIPEFVPCPSDPLHLVLLAKGVRKTLFRE